MKQNKKPQSKNKPPKTTFPVDVTTISNGEKRRIEAKDYKVLSDGRRKTIPVKSLSKKGKNK